MAAKYNPLNVKEVVSKQEYLTIPEWSVLEKGVEEMKNKTKRLLKQTEMKLKFPS